MSSPSTSSSSSLLPCASDAIVTSLLDTDAYKLHMQQAVFHHFPRVMATYQFQCRNHADHLGCYASEIAAQVQQLAHVALREDEYAYLATLPHFTPDYLAYLRSYRFQPSQVTVRVVPASPTAAAATATTTTATSAAAVAAAATPTLTTRVLREDSYHGSSSSSVSSGASCAEVSRCSGAAGEGSRGDANDHGTHPLTTRDDNDTCRAATTVAAAACGAREDASTLSITVDGPWVETILWEVPLLAIVSEVVHRRRHGACVGVDEALATLQRRLDVFFAQHSAEALRGFAVADFGTRRRFSRRVHEAVVRRLRDEGRFAHYLVGTSNYDLARRLGLSAVGTQAHEWFQAFQQLAPQLRHSQTMALEVWLREYQGRLGIALTDCITMDSFLRDFRYELAHAYSGLRQDSGDPVAWAHKALAHYRALGIDAHDKTLVFSDGLTLTRAAALHTRFAREARVMCGIGTQLTCAIDGVVPLNIVMKMVRCQGRPVAKVSDSPGKSIAGESGFVDTLLRTFDVPRRAPAHDAVAAEHTHNSSGNNNDDRNNDKRHHHQQNNGATTNNGVTAHATVAGAAVPSAGDGEDGRTRA